jgi:hypothetical protein
MSATVRRLLTAGLQLERQAGRVPREADARSH